jgi:AcrR family transcriptional regulator
MSRAIAERGYHDAHIGDITKASGVARKTFYDCFGSKKEAALAMIAALGCEGVGVAPSIDLLLVEVAAMRHAGEIERASEFLLAAEHTIRFFGEADLNFPPPADDPKQQRLPPGRHGLPADFIVANQRTRLLSAGAAVIADCGLAASTIADIATQATVSRRIFYSHYDNIGSCARAMVSEFVGTDRLDSLDSRCGLFAIALEILAERIANPEEPSPTASNALGVVYGLTVALGEANLYPRQE